MTSHAETNSGAPAPAARFVPHLAGARVRSVDFLPDTGLFRVTVSGGAASLDGTPETTTVTVDAGRNVVREYGLTLGAAVGAKVLKLLLTISKPPETASPEEPAPSPAVITSAPSKNDGNDGNREGAITIVPPDPEPEPEDTAVTPEPKSGSLLGAVLGAAAGFAFGGPIGTAIGGFFGGIIDAVFGGSDNDGPQKSAGGGGDKELSGGGGDDALDSGQSFGLSDAPVPASHFTDGYKSSVRAEIAAEKAAAAKARQKENQGGDNYEPPDRSSRDRSISGWSGGPGSSLGPEASGPPDSWSPYPVVLDLDGDGLEFVAQEKSTALFDVDGDGYFEKTGWIGPDDGFLIVDLNGDGTVNSADELIIAGQTPDETDTDLQALGTLYDGNGDGVINARDAVWSRLRVWRDLDQDGESDPGELQTMAEAGIASIGLARTELPEGEQDRAGNTLFAAAQYMRPDGSTGVIGDAALAAYEAGHRFVGSAAGVELQIEGADEKILFAKPGAALSVDAFAAGYAAVFGGSGADTVTSSAGEQDAAAGKGRLIAGGGGGADTLTGGAAPDVLNGGAGADRIDGGGGHDVLFIDAEDVSGGLVSGGAGYDIAVVTTAAGVTLNAFAAGLEAVFGNAGADFFTAGGAAEAPHSVVFDGRGGDDALTGGAGNDILSGGEGADVLNGGGGNDVLIADDEDTFDGGEGVDAVYYSSEKDLTLNISSRNVEIFHSGVGDDVLSTDNGRAAAFYGRGGDDELGGGWGGDLLSGGAGTDTLKGGLGSDTYVFAAGDGRDVISDNYTHTGVLYGKQRSEELDAGADDAVLFGPGITAADLILRRSGAALQIALRNDKAAADPAASFDDLPDRIEIRDWENAKRRIESLAFSDGTKLSLAALAREYGLGSGSGAVLDLGAAMAALADGAEAGDVIAGTSEGETLSGPEGGGRVFGLGGDDTLLGSAGADVMDGGAGTDTADYSGSAEGIAIDLGTGTGRGGDAEGDTYESVERFTGTSHDDTFTAGAGAAAFAGGGGTDAAALSGGSGAYTVTAAGGEDGAALRVSDGVQTVTISGVERLQFADRAFDVDGLNVLPSLEEDSFSGDEDAPLEIPAADLLANDRDMGGALTLISVQDAAGGSVSLADGVVRFTPDTDFAGEAQFTYTVQNSEGVRRTGAAVIDVRPVNDAPAAAADSAAVDEDSAVILDVLANDSDIDAGDVLRVTDAAVTGGDSKGRVTVNPDSTLSFTPGAALQSLREGETALVEIEYTIEDSRGATDRAVAEVTVTGVNDAPAAVDDDMGAVNAYGPPLVIPAEQLLANDTDPDAGGGLSVVSAGGAVKSRAVLRTGGGAVFFHPKRRKAGTASFEYTVSDGEGGLSAATAEFTSAKPEGVIYGRNRPDSRLSGGGADDVIDGRNGHDSIYGLGGDDLLYGGRGKDRIDGGEGNDFIHGGLGRDHLAGGAGRDTYFFNRSDGRDTIDNAGGAGGGDTILYGAGIRHDDLWFAQDGRDLRITAFFGGNSEVTVQNWFSDPDAQVDRIETAEGHTLDRSKVDALISAMAAMAPPASGQTHLSEQHKTAHAPALAAAWQTG